MRLCCLAALLSASAFAQPPADKQAAIGAYLASQLRQTTSPVDNPVVAAYVARIGSMFADGRNCTFDVVTGEIGGYTHEPIAFPGCYVFVSTSLLLAARDEAEFAAMMAHSLAHDARPVGTVNNSGGSPLVFMGGWGNFADQGLALPGSFQKALRARELEADRVAVHAMPAAGFDPQAFVRYISELRPADPERIASLEQAVGELPVRTYAPDNEEFARVQDAVRPPPVAPRAIPTLLRPGESSH